MSEEANIMFKPLRFIEEVRARPGLYEPAHPLDKSERLELWKQVGAALLPDWHSYSSAAVYDTVLQLQRKWRSFRDAYSRELRTRRQEAARPSSRPRARARRPYRFFKKLTFLGGFDGELSSESETTDLVDEPRPLYKNEVDQSYVDEGVNDVDEETRTEEEKEGSIVPTSLKKKIKRRRSSSVQAPEEYEMPLSLFSPDVSDDSNNTTFKSDGDRLFLLSFAPELRQFPPQLRLWARSQISNVMLEAVNCHLNKTTPRTMFGTP